MKKVLKEQKKVLKKVGFELALARYRHPAPRCKLAHDY